MPLKIAVVVAAGSGERFGGDKAFATVSERPLLWWACQSLIPYIDRLVVVTKRDRLDEAAAILPQALMVAGGQTRTQSEARGIAALAEVEGSAIIAIHDGARPNPGRRLVEELFAVALETGGAIPGLIPDRPVVDVATLKRRDGLVVVQTPQMYRLETLRIALAAADAEGFSGDDTEDVVRRYKLASDTAVVAGDPENIKVTYPEDLQRVAGLLRSRERSEPR